MTARTRGGALRADSPGGVCHQEVDSRPGIPSARDTSSVLEEHQMTPIRHTGYRWPLRLLSSLALMAPALSAWYIAAHTAQTATTQVQLMAADGLPTDNFGSAVAIDGNLMAVSAPFA